MFKITFDQKTSAYASKDFESNLMFIRINEHHFNDLLKIRGYVYINSIYESLGIKWDPKWDNVCYIYEEGKRIEFEIVVPFGTEQIKVNIDLH